MSLCIVRQIVAEYDGLISVTSRVGEGSVFTVRLPHVIERTAHSPEAQLSTSQ